MIPPVVSSTWLRAQLADARDDLAICDVRTTMNEPDPRASYRARHLPGAAFVDLDADLADPARPVAGRHPLPSPERFASLLGARGISARHVVVAYDVGPGAFAARLVWMLRILGREAALLDGGLAHWDGPTESGDAPRTAVDVPAVEWPAAAIADADDVAAHLTAGGTVVDSRDAARFRGETEPIDPVAGHVPGATNLPFAENLVDGTFRRAAELAERFAALGHDPSPIVYCGSGVTACHNALAVEHAGLPRPRVYVGSWSGWSSDEARPVATGPG